MGWSSGEKVFLDIKDGIDKIEDLSYEQKIKIYISIIDALESSDWDTQDEVIGYDPIVDEAMKKLHPDWFMEGE